MQAEQKSNPQTAAPAGSPADGKREQSSVAFPYLDLDAAIGVVRDIQQIGGQSCEGDQLAGFWKISMAGGNFRARYAPARTFGLLQVERGHFTLTPVGMRIVDRTQEAAAKIEAFMSVPLYKAVYEKYRNYQLPGSQALEEEMVRLGVAVKQKGIARQVFLRSAKTAGFFWAGEDRLVRPNIAASVASPETLPQEAADRPPQEAPSVNGTGARYGGGGGGYHPFIEGLLATLPEPGTLWAVEGRAAWLQAAAQNFMLIYKGDGKIDVSVTGKEIGPRQS